MKIPPIYFGGGRGVWRECQVFLPTPENARIHELWCLHTRQSALRPWIIFAEFWRAQKSRFESRATRGLRPASPSGRAASKCSGARSKVWRDQSEHFQGYVEKLDTPARPPSPLENKWPGFSFSKVVYSMTYCIQMRKTARKKISDFSRPSKLRFFPPGSGLRPENRFNENLTSNRQCILVSVAKWTPPQPRPAVFVMEVSLAAAKRFIVGAMRRAAPGCRVYLNFGGGAETTIELTTGTPNAVKIMELFLSRCTSPSPTPFRETHTTSARVFSWTRSPGRGPASCGRSVRACLISV